MSYSFQVQGASKAEVMNLVAAELDKVVQAQPVHQADRAQAQAAAQSLVDALGDTEGKGVSVSVAGWVVTQDQVATAVSLNVTAALVSNTRAPVDTPANA